ncbi:MAG TPA: diiron oxygenase [Candidatus Binatia bacterium]|nr:diiron oxygenase [Candidatus Binatia bacterium]
MLTGPNDIPDEERPTATGEAYADLVRRLSRQSVAKHFDAYADVPWDAPDHRLDPDDPRFELAPDHPLGGTDWYRSQQPAARARISLHMVATQMKVGAQFENALQRGLLELAFTLPTEAPELRYAYHEMIEEGQHSLMFHEFVRRSGFDVPGLGWLDRVGARSVVRTARTFPELFFVFVLGGEDPIDHAQRSALQSGRELHPLLRRIMQIHVTEEARHLCFARAYLREHVPRLSARRRRWLALRAPLILGTMFQMMLRPSRQVVRRWAIPRDVIARAYTKNPDHRAFARASLAKVHALLGELGLLTAPAVRLWRLMGIWEKARA